MTTEITRTHYSQLDGLRGIAILSVMIYHFCLPHTNFHGQGSGWLLQIAQAGWLGVDLFFVLSGFLITGILIETRSQPRYFRNFLGRRFLRIWPLYYMSLLLLVVIFPLILPTVPPQLQSMQDKQAWFWLYGANWLFAQEGGFSQTSGGYFWSLAVEEQFYIFWPFVVYALSVKTLLRVSCALIVMSLVSRIVLFQLGVSTGALYTMTFTHLDGLAVGSCLAICLRSPSLRSQILRWLPLAALFSLCGLIAIRVADGNAFFWSKHMAIFGYTFASVLFGALLFWTLTSGNIFGLSRLFESRILRASGKYSYALYMVHVPVASILFPIGRRVLGRFETIAGYDAIFFACALFSFIASWLLAVLSWNLFEKPILGLKRYFTYEHENRVAK